MSPISRGPVPRLASSRHVNKVSIYLSSNGNKNAIIVKEVGSLLSYTVIAMSEAGIEVKAKVHFASLWKSMRK